MKLLIVRHGDPDYAHDTLTEKGEREAILLSQRLSTLENVHFYCSPLGRAQKTASYTLEKKKASAETLDWLREFPTALVIDGHRTCCWDRPPSIWINDPIYFGKDWYRGPLYADTTAKEDYQRVCAGLDELLERHGYRHTGNAFESFDPNMDTVVLFCHLGVECVMLSHLLGISPVILWHFTCPLTTSVTTLVTEEREQGTSILRMIGFSDISHLDSGHEPSSFAARFCEMYSNSDERH